MRLEGKGRDGAAAVERVGVDRCAGAAPWSTRGTTARRGAAVGGGRHLHVNRAGIVGLKTAGGAEAGGPRASSAGSFVPVRAVRRSLGALLLRKPPRVLRRVLAEECAGGGLPTAAECAARPAASVELVGGGGVRWRGRWSCWHALHLLTAALLVAGTAYATLCRLPARRRRRPAAARGALRGTLISVAQEAAALRLLLLEPLGSG